MVINGLKIHGERSLIANPAYRGWIEGNFGSFAEEMKWKSIYKISIISLLIFVSCKREINVKKISISEILDRYSYLYHYPDDKQNLEKQLKLDKVIIINDYSLYFYTSFSSDAKFRELFAIKNSSDKVYSIPIFNTKYRDYWNFKFLDGTYKDVPKIKTTFEKEIKTAIKVLKFNTSSDDWLYIINEIFNCLDARRWIDTQDIRHDKADSIMFFRTSMISDNVGCSENIETTCKERKLRNWEYLKSKQGINGTIGYDCGDKIFVIYRDDYRAPKKDGDFHVDCLMNWCYQYIPIMNE